MLKLLCVGRRSLSLDDLLRVGVAVGLAAVILAAPLGAAWAAEPADGPPKLGYFGPQGSLHILREGLEALGYIDGQNILLEVRLGQTPDEYQRALEDLIALPVDVLASGDSVALTLAKEANISIPVVMVAVGNPVASGLVASLEHPGGNFTGTTVESPGLVGQQVAVLKEAFPEISRLTALYQAEHPLTPSSSARLQAAGAELGIDVQVRPVGSRADIEAAFEAALDEGTEGFFVARQPVTVANRQRIVELATTSGLPAMYPTREWAEAGGLMAYGVDAAEVGRRAATYVDKIFQGAEPAELPVEGPIKFEFVVNLQTAQALGLNIPESVLAQATEVITTSAAAQEAADSIVDLLPTGELRVALFTNAWFPNLATPDPQTGEVVGIGGDLARALADRIGVAVAWVKYPRHGAVIAAANDDAWDIYFIGLEAVQAQGWHASPPYVLVDQTYLVPAESPYSSVAEVDQPGVRISSWQGSGTDLFLARELAHAELVRVGSGGLALALLLSGEVDAYASNRQTLVELADQNPGFRVLGDFFTVGGIVIAVPKSDPALLAAITDFVEWAKATGLVEDSILRQGLERQVRVAAPAGS